MADAVLGCVADVCDGDVELGLVVELRFGGDVVLMMVMLLWVRCMVWKWEVRSEARAANSNAANSNAVLVKVKVKLFWVVDFGCGEGYYLFVVFECVRVWDDVELEFVALDVSKDVVDLCAAVIGWFVCVVVVDVMCDLFLDDDSVDVVMSVFVLCLLMEFVRVLRKGGWVVVASSDDDYMVEFRDAFWDDDKIIVFGVELNKFICVDEVFFVVGFDVVFWCVICDVVLFFVDVVVDFVFMGSSGFYNLELVICDVVGDVLCVVMILFNVVVYVLFWWCCVYRFLYCCVVC